jgi:hypothetical protein
MSRVGHRRLASLVIMRVSGSVRAIGSPCESGLYPGPSAATCRNAANFSSSRRWDASYLCNTSSASAVRCPSARSSSVRRRWRAKDFSPLAAIASRSSILLACSESMSAAMHDGLKGGVTSSGPAACSRGRLLATAPCVAQKSRRVPVAKVHEVLPRQEVGQVIDRVPAATARHRRPSGNPLRSCSGRG